MAKKKGKGKKKGKKKGGYKRKASKKKGGSRPAQKKHLGAMLGTAKSVYDMETNPAGPYSSDLYLVQKNAVVTAVKGDFSLVVPAAKATLDGALSHGGPAVIGMAVSYGEDIPLIGDVVKEIKRPLNRFIGKMERKLTKRKRRWWL